MGISDKHFLVVGGAGFLGARLAGQLLDSGASQVRIYDNLFRGTRVNIEKPALNWALRPQSIWIVGSGS